jgi:hypothetical protein
VVQPRPEKERNETTKPESARARTIGVVRPAVDGERVVRPPIAMSAPKPSGMRNTSGRRRPAMDPTSRPRPAESRPRTSGKMIQETIRGPER